VLDPGATPGISTIAIHVRQGFIGGRGIIAKNSADFDECCWCSYTNEKPNIERPRIINKQKRQKIPNLCNKATL